MQLMAWPSRTSALSEIPAQPAPESESNAGMDVDVPREEVVAKGSGTTVHVGIGGMEHSKTHPRALASLGTAHTWSFGALAEVGANIR
jgi:hypothetical protein